jgi:hypothetical protein
MVIALKLSKDLKNISLEELVSSLRRHEIELEEDESQKKIKFVALKSISKGDRSESTSRGKSNKEITCYECKETCHYINECPKLEKESSRKENFKKNSFRTKKGLMATWDDSGSDSSESDSDEQANVALMATTSKNTSDVESEFEEVFSDLSRSDL